MEQTLQDRLGQLERLVASLRHDIRNQLTPAALIADLLNTNGDSSIRHSAHTLVRVVERIVSTLDATYDVVPPRD